MDPIVRVWVRHLVGRVGAAAAAVPTPAPTGPYSRLGLVVRTCWKDGGALLKHRTFMHINHLVCHRLTVKIHSQCSSVVRLTLSNLMRCTSICFSTAINPKIHWRMSVYDHRHFLGCFFLIKKGWLAFYFSRPWLAYWILLATSPVLLFIGYLLLQRIKPDMLVTAFCWK